YLGRWKALQYYARRFYNDLLLSPHIENGSVNFYIVSDRATPTRAQLTVGLMDFEGHALASANRDIEVASLQSKSYLSLPVSELLAGRDEKKVFLYCELLVEGKAASSNEVFFQSYKNLSLPVPQISADVTRTASGFRIGLSADKFARGVCLSIA